MTWLKTRSLIDTQMLRSSSCTCLITHSYVSGWPSLYSPSQSENNVAVQSVIPYVTSIGSAKFRRWIVDHWPSKAVKHFRDIVDTMHETSVEIYESKLEAIKKGDDALAAQIGRGKDIISILRQLELGFTLHVYYFLLNMKIQSRPIWKQKTMTSYQKKNSWDKSRRFLFFSPLWYFLLKFPDSSLTFAATDTTSGALTRTFHLLAQHKDVQAKVREEIRNARKANGGQDIDYDTLASLPFLDAVCRETLRLWVELFRLISLKRSSLIDFLPFTCSYPPVSTVIRVCVHFQELTFMKYICILTILRISARQDALLPLSTPVRGQDGQDIKEILVPKGTDVYVSILNANTNPELWGPDAGEWKPSRWLNPLPQTLVDAKIPGVYSHL